MKEVPGALEKQIQANICRWTYRRYIRSVISYYRESTQALRKEMDGLPSFQSLTVTMALCGADTARVEYK